jgi:hypothetical protein
MAVAGSEPFAPRLLPSSGRPFIDGLCRELHASLSNDFALRVSLRFYDDAGQPNALADPIVLHPDARDGTVLLGVNLIKEEIGVARDEVYAVTKIAVIVAHEFGHLLQYKNGLTRDGPWQMEPHADFMAGWGLARQAQEFKPPQPGILPSPLNLYLPIFGNADAVQTMFEKGDTLFDHPDHHGEPRFRARMVQAGYNAKALDIRAVFERGSAEAGLPRPPSPDGR